LRDFGIFGQEIKEKSGGFVGVGVWIFGGGYWSCNIGWKTSARIHVSETISAMEEKRTSYFTKIIKIN
jgi:hypothetical protein